MDLIVSWALFPLLLIAICAGCGLLVAALVGRRLPTPLLPAVGLAVVVVVGQFLTLGDATAELTTPVTVALALLGIALAVRHRGGGRGTEPWLGAAAAAAVVFCVYAAPIVLSGEATLAGFIKLDDTATWLALTDRVIEHGRSLDGLALSTYEATLHFNLADGYPIGVFLPLGVGAQLSGTDVAWLIQPYMALLAAMLALALWSLAAPLAGRPALRFGAAAIGAQPALLFGYYLWGGVKEVAAAALIASTVAALVWLLAEPADRRRLVVPVLLAGALLGVLSAGALVWLAPVVVGASILLARRIGAAASAIRLALGGLALALLSLPLIVPGALLPPTSSPLTDDGARGNLIAPLDPAQVAGIWAAGDFRVEPGDELLTVALIAVATIAALATLAWCAQRRTWGVPLYVAGVLGGCFAIAAIGSPWVDGKAFASAAAAIPFAAMVGAGLLALAGRRVPALLLGLAVAAGVLWSNLLAYREVNLAPRAQLAELERIGELVGGAGPTLITEYSPYGARHFLREGDPESISELRRRPVELRDGSQVRKGGSADVDAIDPAALAAYPSLVVRRSPAASRPPSQYTLAWAGEYYELWQRTGPAPRRRLALGDRFDPLGEPDCARVRRLAQAAGEGDQLLAARRPAATIVPLSAARYPHEWRNGSPAYAPRPSGAGTLATVVELPAEGTYELWLGGSVRPLVSARIDGETIAEQRHQLNNLGGYVGFGGAELAAGRHLVELGFHGPDLAPGSEGVADPIGPLVLSRGDAATTTLVRVEPAAAERRLCGRRWDWIELVATPG